MFPERIKNIRHLSTDEAANKALISFQYDNSDEMFRDILGKFNESTEVTIVHTYKNVRIESATSNETIIAVDGIEYSTHITNADDDSDDAKVPVVDVSQIEADRDRAISDAATMHAHNDKLEAEALELMAANEQLQASLDAVTAQLTEAQARLAALTPPPAEDAGTQVEEQPTAEEPAPAEGEAPAEEVPAEEVPAEEVKTTEETTTETAPVEASTQRSTRKSRTSTEETPVTETEEDAAKLQQ